MLASVAGGKKVPVFLSGDFNATPETAIIQNLMKQGPFADPFLEFGLPVANSGTFHDFTGRAGEERLDYIFHNDQATALEYGKLVKANAGVNHNKYPSDHFPVWTLFQMK